MPSIESVSHIADEPLPNSPSRPHPVYDAAIIPGGPIMHHDGEYIPADYSQLRQARYATIERICGLWAMYTSRHLVSSPEILFTGGVSEPTNGRIGGGPVPPEATVCSRFFINGLPVIARNNPDFAEWLRPQTITIHEDTSANSSAENALIAQALAQERRWKTVVASTNQLHWGRFQSLLRDPAYQPECGTQFNVEPGERWKTAVFGHSQGEMERLLYPHLFYKSVTIPEWIEIHNQQIAREHSGLEDMRNGTYVPEVGVARSPDLSGIKTWKVAATDILPP